MLLLALKVPSVQKEVQRQMNEARVEIEDKLIPKGTPRHLALPEKGKSVEWILEEMAKMDSKMGPSADWRRAKLSGAIYRTSLDTPSFTVSQFLIDGEDDLLKVVVAAFERYTLSNPLHPDVFPTIRQMEAEIVSMCLRMYNNPDGAGTMTSGGTESIVMAVKTYRDWAREVKGITDPEMWVSKLLRYVSHNADACVTGSFQ